MRQRRRPAIYMHLKLFRRRRQHCRKTQLETFFSNSRIRFRRSQRDKKSEKDAQKQWSTVCNTKRKIITRKTRADKTQNETNDTRATQIKNRCTHRTAAYQISHAANF